MPIYNVAPYVERALLSALNQTFDSIEFLIVDDRGTDNSMDIVRKIVAEHPRGKDVRIIEHPHNIGLGATRNTAIDNAKGEYLFFMDSDDEITPDCIEVLYKAMMEEPVDFVAGSLVRCSNNRSVLKSVQLPNIFISGKYSLIHYFYKERKMFFIETWNKLYSVNFLRVNKIKCKPYHLCEDQMFTFQVAVCANNCKLIDVITYYYSCYVVNSTTYKEKNQYLSLKNIIEYNDILSYKKKCIEQYFKDYGYLLVDNYFSDMIRVSNLLIKSKIPSEKKKKYMISICNIPFAKRGRYKLEVKTNIVFNSMICISNNINYRIVCLLLILILRNIKGMFR